MKVVIDVAWLTDRGESQEIAELMPNGEVLATMDPDELAGRTIQSAEVDDRGRVVLDLV